MNYKIKFIGLFVFTFFMGCIVNTALTWLYRVVCL